MCFIVPVSSQRHLSSSSFPHLTRLTGEGSTSYVDLMRKLVLDVVHFQSSRQVTFLSSTFSSHAIICPCCPHCASLVVLFFFFSARLSSPALSQQAASLLASWSKRVQMDEARTPICHQRPGLPPLCPHAPVPQTECHPTV